MRIVGEIPHPVMKITLFKMDTKYSIKFEDALFEQTYKFREGDTIQSIQDIYKLVDESFLKEVETILQNMKALSSSALEKARKNTLDEFEEII